MDFHQDECDSWVARHNMTGAHDPFRFRRELGLPDDPRAMTLDQLDQLIAYHESLRKRFDEAFARIAAVSEQIEAALREHGGEVVGDLRGTDAAALREEWIEAGAECDWCRREVEAVGAYAEPLLRTTGDEG